MPDDRIKSFAAPAPGRRTGIVGKADDNGELPVDDRATRAAKAEGRVRNAIGDLRDAMRRALKRNP